MPKRDGFSNKKETRLEDSTLKKRKDLFYYTKQFQQKILPFTNRAKGTDYPGIRAIYFDISFI